MPWPDGHFYSPVPSESDLARERPIGDPFGGISYDIEKDVERSLERLRLLEEIVPLSFESFGNYHTTNDQFNKADASFLGSFIVSERPARIVEVGSGWSTCMISATVGAANLQTKIAAVEPFPSRLFEALPNFPRGDLQECKIQDVGPLSFGLSDVDLLFIDSSHVVKYQSDVLYEVFEWIPNLRKGALIHFHDIFYPWEYPKAWRDEGRFWNEIYMLRALLQDSDRLEIVSWPSAIMNIREEIWDSQFGPNLGAAGGSIWLRVLK